MTDYSSVFFDFANLKRPMIFYMYDLDDYKNNLRDFYLDLDELPGPITKNEEELEEAIKNIDEISKKFNCISFTMSRKFIFHILFKFDKISKKYKEKYEKFNKKFNYLDDGQATKRVINKIFNLKDISQEKKEVIKK